jgi:hypothetical protein
MNVKNGFGPPNVEHMQPHVCTAWDAVIPKTYYHKLTWCSPAWYPLLMMAWTAKIQCRSRHDLDRSLWAWLCCHWRSTVGKFAGWWRSKRLPAIIHVRCSGNSKILWQTFCCQNEVLKVGTSRDRTELLRTYNNYKDTATDHMHNPARTG